MDEIYKRIQDGLNRWMKSVGMSQRDEFRGGMRMPLFWLDLLMLYKR